MATVKKSKRLKDHLKDLPRYVDPDVHRKEKLYREKDKIKEILAKRGQSINSTTLSLEYASARAIKDDIEEELKAINLRVDALTEMISDQFEIDEVSGVRLDDGTLITASFNSYAGVEDREKLQKWAIENGYQAQLQLPWPTLNSLTTNLLEAGEAAPDGVRVFLKPALRRTRARE